jgi:hypothetical protein
LAAHRGCSGKLGGGRCGGSRRLAMGSRKLEIPEELYLEIEGILDKLGMGSVDECVEFVFRALLSGDYDRDELSAEEEKRMKERLSDLGYM